MQQSLGHTAVHRREQRRYFFFRRCRFQFTARETLIASRSQPW
jgi:hypothetical protein